ncbi:putative NIMA interactive protein [Seiridium cardinale]|uniref:NIMA interactive protein n=1 Tax=Seiridium cardinale TaxID=138064 RepID=A0ABR2Y7L6_9PEZI
MIESDNLKTASLYINNQLLSRGLLRDGQNIDFADPDAGTGLQATMGKIMGVVNDLILRRDRDAVQRESLSNTLLSLRADAQRHTTENARLSERLEDTQRKLDGADATERTLRLQVKSTESTVHKLKDEMAKMKSLVAQSRAACANEVRKRDRQIDSLKKAVVDAGRVRGGNKNRDVVSITVIGDTGSEGSDDGITRVSTHDEEYSLRMETNEFLTELAKSLSEENSTLLNLVHRTVKNLREMSGLDRAMDESMRTGGQIANPPPRPHRNAEELANELEGILEHLRTILTNPSFVPIEEVEIRDTEIVRLREGWERMEARWKDAVNMMDGWRRRMASSGTTVNMEELQMGLRLSPVRSAGAREPAQDCETHYQELSCVQEEDEEEEEISQFERSRSPSRAESLHLVPAPGYEVDEQDEDEDSSIFQDDVDIDELDADEPNVQVLQASTDTSVDSPPLPNPPQLSPLKDSYSSVNRGSQHSNSDSYRKKPGDFTTIIEEKTWELAAATREPEAPVPPPHGLRLQPSHKSLKAALEMQDQLKPSSTASYDSTLFGESYESPIRSNPSRKLFSKPPPKSTEPETKPERKQETGKDREAEAETETETKQQTPLPHVPRSQQPTQASSKKKAVNHAVSPVGPPKPVSSTKKTTKRTASAPDATTRTAPATEKQTSKSTGNTTTRDRSPVRPSGNSRLPRRNNPPVQQSPITMAAISAKLEASERQADAARVRAKLRAARTGCKPGTTTMAPAQTSPKKGGESTDPVKRDMPAPPVIQVADPDEDELMKPNEGLQDRDLKPEKRRRDKRPSKAVSRRRSTLNPWELESLIQGNMEGVPSPTR